MGQFISPEGNREIWKVKPEGYFTDEEWKAIHPDKIYSVIGTNVVRIMPFPYGVVIGNEVEMTSFPPDDMSISTSDGTWVESEELVNLKMAELKNARLDELNLAFDQASRNAHCLSSTGFEINADETANRNISSLIIALEATGQKTIQFCAYDNNFYDVTLAQLKTMQLEIIANAQAIYAVKWALRDAINAAGTIEAIHAIEIGFDEGDE